MTASAHTSPRKYSRWGGSLRWRISPRGEAACLGLMATFALTCTVIASAAATVGLVARIPLAASVFGWCERLAGSSPWWLGIPAATYLAVLVAGGTAVSVRHLQARPAKDAPGVVVVDTAQVFAYSLGGRGGQVVTSRGLLEQMDPEERRVIFAHEAAHLRLGHHRLLWLADLAALNPLMRPLRKRMRFALERAADEEAVRAVGDRALVARTVGRAALLSLDRAPSPALSIDGSGVVGRVEALLSPAEVAPPAGSLVASAALIVVAFSLAWSQWTHLAGLAHHLCVI